MADLHLLLVIDSEDGRVWIEGMETAPVDSDMAVFDDPHWRGPTGEEVDILINATYVIAHALEGVRVPTHD